MPDETDFERRLRAALHREADGLPLRIDAARVREGMTSGRHLPSWLPQIGIPIGAALFVAIVVINVFPGEASPGPGSGSATAAPTTATQGPPAAAAPSHPVPQPTAHPAQRRNAAVAIADGVAYLAGGVGERGTLRTVTAFNGRVWTDLPSLPEPRAGAAGAILPDGRLLVAGGEVDAAPTASTLLLEPGGTEWTEGAEMPHAQAHMGVAVIDGRVHLFGGSATEHGADVLIFNPATQAWTLGAPMPAAASHAAAAALDGVAYVFGGRAERGDPSTSTASVNRYDPVADAWQPLPDMPSAGSNLTATPVDGRLWVIGGQAAEFQGAVATYDPATQAWTQQADGRSLPGVWHAALPQNNGTILMVGGWPFLNTRVIDTRSP